MEVREIRPDELDALGRLTVEAYSALPESGAWAGYIRELANVAARLETSVVLVAVEDGAVLGGVTYVAQTDPAPEDADPDEAWIRHLAVAPGAQRRGAGTALVAACVARARAEGKRRLRLYTTPSMTVAHRIYERAGFRRDADVELRPDSTVCLWSYALDLDRYGDPVGPGGENR